MPAQPVILTGYMNAEWPAGRFQQLVQADVIASHAAKDAATSQWHSNSSVLQGIRQM
jgi:hypothetical protein